MDFPNPDLQPQFGESGQKSGSSRPATQLAKATQGCLNLLQPASFGESLPTQKTLSPHHLLGTTHHSIHQHLLPTPKKKMAKIDPSLSVSLLSDSQNVVDVHAQKTPTKESTSKNNNENKSTPVPETSQT